MYSLKIVLPIRNMIALGIPRIATSKSATARLAIKRCVTE